MNNFHIWKCHFSEKLEVQYWIHIVYDLNSSGGFVFWSSVLGEIRFSKFPVTPKSVKGVENIVMPKIDCHYLLLVIW